MRFFTTVYVLLLAYIIAALVFWGLSLQRQSRFIFNQERATLKEKIDSAAAPALYRERLQTLEERRNARTHQYLGEGLTFLIIILAGAGVVYSSIRRSIRLSRQQNNFMLSVTHELKSPIAGMKLSLQTIQKHQLPEEQRQQLIARCIEESDRLNDLCNNMLLTSQMEGRQYKPAHQEVDLSQLVEDILRAYGGRYQDRFIADIEEGCIVSGDVMLLQMAVHNLLENAIKYTPPKSLIRVCVQRYKRQITVQVADQGHGIPEGEKKKILTKFYRIGDETTRKTKGTGLGLYLTARIMRQHHGTITVKDNQPAGAVFELCLPAKE